MLIGNWYTLKDLAGILEDQSSINAGKREDKSLKKLSNDYMDIFFC